MDCSIAIVVDWCSGTTGELRGAGSRKDEGGVDPLFMVLDEAVRERSITKVL